MKKAEILAGLLKICCNSYRYPPEAMVEAERFFLPNSTLVCKVTSGYESKFEFKKGFPKKILTYILT